MIKILNETNNNIILNEFDPADFLSKEQLIDVAKRVGISSIFSVITFNALKKDMKKKLKNDYTKILNDELKRLGKK